jgi:hypothetical protein
MAKFGLDKCQRCRFPPRVPWCNSGVNVHPLTTWKSRKIREFSAVTGAPSWRLLLGFSEAECWTPGIKPRKSGDCLCEWLHLSRKDSSPSPLCFSRHVLAPKSVYRELERMATLSAMPTSRRGCRGKLAGRQIAARSHASTSWRHGLLVERQADVCRALTKTVREFCGNQSCIVVLG